jgi:peptidoglycan/xylan/chitin deacetylase (PgdA/CDA1 family)
VPRRRSSTLRQRLDGARQTAILLGAAAGAAVARRWRWEAGGAAGLAAVLGSLFLALALTSPPAATVNGRRVVLGPRTTVVAAMRSARVRFPGGVLYSVVQHRVLLRDDIAIPAVITVNGRRASAGRVLHDGDVVRVTPGSAPEPTVVREEPAAAPLLRKGAEDESLLAAPLPSSDGGVPEVETQLWHPSSPAVREVVLGARSGEVVSESPPQPAVPASPERGKVVALSFDDGPDPTWTPRILWILKAEGIHATFCLIGREVLQYPQLVRQEALSGETLCDHTVDHDEHLATKPAGDIEYEIDHAADEIRAAGGEEPAFYRPPGGTLSSTIVSTAEARGLKVLMWSVDPSDYLAPPAPVIEQRILSKIGPGAIVELHDGGGDRSHTVAMLKGLVDTLRGLGYSFTTPAEEQPLSVPTSASQAPPAQPPVPSNGHE